jgi:hypothetical protein
MKTLKQQLKKIIKHYDDLESIVEIEDAYYSDDTNYQLEMIKKYEQSKTNNDVS